MKRAYFIFIIILQAQITVSQDTVWICLDNNWPIPNKICNDYHLVNFDNTYNPIKIDSGSNNLWQIGTPNKSIFTSSSNKRSIVTDSINPYPINNFSSFQIIIIGNFHPYGFELWFDHKYDTDQGKDGGCIEIYNRKERKWENILDFEYQFYFQNLYSKSDTISALLSKQGFSGYKSDWENVHIVSPRQGGLDTIRVRFVFASDSIDSKKDGWIIDNFEFMGLYESVSEEQYDSFYVFPNPFTESTTLFFRNPEKYKYELYIMDISGKVCRIENDITTSEYLLVKGDLKQGFYFIELRGPNIYRGKVIIE